MPPPPTLSPFSLVYGLPICERFPTYLSSLLVEQLELKLVLVVLLRAYAEQTLMELKRCFLRKWPVLLCTRPNRQDACSVQGCAGANIASSVVLILAKEIVRLSMMRGVV